MLKPRHNCGSIEGMAPDGNGRAEYWVSKDRLAAFYTNGKLDKYKEMHLVKEVLDHPERDTGDNCGHGFSEDDGRD